MIKDIATHERAKRIEVQGLYKSFDAYCIDRSSILSFIIDTLTFKKRTKHITIADGLSFDVYSGEILGIIGANGAGKSSLLRLVAGIYEPDSGSIKTNGKVVYLSSVGQGLVPKLTMRENIFLMGSVLGLKQKEIRQKMDQIVEFSGLKDHLDMKVYQFSAGMMTRLVFSVMIYCVSHQNPDILLIDEVLSAGGDADFQGKAIGKMEELIRGGAAVILVSHDMELLKRYCDEVVWLDTGVITRKDKPNVVINEYLKSFNKRSFS